MKKIDLESFQKKVVVRSIQMDDYDQIVDIQTLCFPGMQPWSREQIASQISIFPEGQICVEYNGKVVASSSSLIIDFDMYGEKHSWFDIADRGMIRNHNPDGDTLYGIEIMVHPDYRGMKLARRLYEARKQLCREKNLMRIVIGGRIPGYSKHQSTLTAREYVEKVQNKSLVDPVLTTQLSNGFVLKRLIQSYMATDNESCGWATLMEWTNLDYDPSPRKQYLASRPVRICAVQYQMRKVRDFDDFANQCEYFVDVASDYKCDFILFPEIFTTQLLSCIEPQRPGMAARELHRFTPQYLDLFSKLSIRYNVNIIGGTHFIVENERLYNTAYLFKRNGDIGQQKKLHVTPNERRWWGVEPGDELQIFDTDRGKISIQVCYDIQFPELSRLAVERGAELIFVPFCTDERHGYLRVRYCAQARCIENQVYVAIAGTVGNLPYVENMDIQYAQSGIFTPSDFIFARDGIAAECTPNVETVVIHDVDLEKIRHHRNRGTTRNWYDRRHDLYEVIHKNAR